MNNNITRVDFVNKRRRDFVEEQEVTKQEFLEAVEKVNAFMKFDYDAKIQEYSALEQVILHTIEDADEKTLTENAVDLILSLHDITNTRRNMKQCEEVKKVASSKLSVTNSSHLNNEVSQKVKYHEKGSSKKYYEGKMRRVGKYVDKDKMKKALFEHLLTDKKEKEM